MKHRIARILPHLTIVLSLMTLTFFGIDRVNVNMAFMTSEMSKWLFAALAVLSIVTSFLLIAFQWRADAKDEKKRLRQIEREQRASDELFRTHERPAPTAQAAGDNASDEPDGDASDDEPEDEADAPEEAGDAPNETDGEIVATDEANEKAPEPDKTENVGKKEEADKD